MFAAVFFSIVGNHRCRIGANLSLPQVTVAVRKNLPCERVRQSRSVAFRCLMSGIRDRRGDHLRGRGFQIVSYNERICIRKLAWFIIDPVEFAGGSL
jgi:hypothetical protein